MFAVDRAETGPEVWGEIFRDLFDLSVEADLVPVDVDYRVIENVGLVWGLIQFVIESEKGVSSNQQTRLTAVFKKDGENWRIVSWHDSAPPGR